MKEAWDLFRCCISAETTQGTSSHTPPTVVVELPNKGREVAVAEIRRQEPLQQQDLLRTIQHEREPARSIVLSTERSMILALERDKTTENTPPLTQY